MLNVGAFASTILSFFLEKLKEHRPCIGRLTIYGDCVTPRFITSRQPANCPHCLCTSQVKHTVRIFSLAISFWLPSQLCSFLRKLQCNVLQWELMYTTDQWSGIFCYSSTLSLTQVRCWYWEAMACVRSDSNTGLSAVTWLIWPSVIKKPFLSPFHISNKLLQYVLIDSRLDISTAPRSLLEETVIPRSLLFFYCDPFDANVQKLSRRRIPLRGSHVDDSGSCMSSPEQEEGERICVALDFQSWFPC